jgi:hypothetical protein
MMQSVHHLQLMLLMIMYMAAWIAMRVTMIVMQPLMMEAAIMQKKILIVVVIVL